jgi:hypothetical protein
MAVPPGSTDFKDRQREPHESVPASGTHRFTNSGGLIRRKPESSESVSARRTRFVPHEQNPRHVTPIQQRERNLDMPRIIFAAA